MRFDRMLADIKRLADPLTAKAPAYEHQDLLFPAGKPQPFLEIVGE